METIRLKEYINAVTVLNQAVQNKRFHIVENQADFLGDDLSTSINEEIREQYGLDLPSLATDSDLLRYSELLQDKLSKRIKKTYFNASISEEIEMLEAIKDASIEDYQKLDLDSVLSSKTTTRKIFDTIGVTQPSLKYSLTHPEKVQVIDMSSGKYPHNGSKQYLVSSKLKIKSKDAFVLYHFIIPYTSNSKPFIGTCFFFSKNNSRLSSPARMFLQGLNEYGNEINIGGEKKRFFFQKSVIQTDDNRMKSVSDVAKTVIPSIERGRGDAIITFSIAGTDDIAIYQFAYLVLQDEIVADVKKGIFL